MATYTGIAATQSVFDALWRAAKGTRDAAAHGGDSDSDSGMAGPMLRGVVLPDTVFVQHGRMSRWYFTAKDGTVKAKSRPKLTTANVVEFLMSRKCSDKSGGPLPLPVQLWEDGEAAAPASGGAAATLEMTTVPSAGIHDMLSSHPFTGLLQPFVVPRSSGPANPKRRGGSGAMSVSSSSISMAGVHNLIIIANWTPNVLYLEQRTNSLTLIPTSATTDRVGMQPPGLSDEEEVLAHPEHGSAERQRGPMDPRSDAAQARWTLSLASRFVRSTSVTSTYTMARVEAACKAVAEQVQRGLPTDGSVGSGRVSNLVCYFKVHPVDDALVLLGVEKVVFGSGGVDTSNGKGGRVVATPEHDGDDDEETPARRQTSSVEAPNTKSLNKATRGPAVKICKCALCAAFSSDDLPPTAFSRMAQRHVLVPLELLCLRQSPPPAPQEAGAPPPAVRMLHPDMTAAEYDRVKDNAKWLDTTVIVLCPRCVEALHNVVSERPAPAKTTTIKRAASSSNTTRADDSRQSRRPISQQSNVSLPSVGKPRTPNAAQ